MSEFLPEIRERDFILPDEHPGLDEWLAWLDDPPDFSFVRWSFPTDRHRDEYVERIDSWSDNQVRRLLRSFLIESGSLGCDDRIWEEREYLRKNSASNPRLHALRNVPDGREYFRRLAHWQVMEKRGPPPWEGVTWILDLLPRFPQRAIDAVTAYIDAHLHVLPDGRIDGLADVADLIRIRYLGLPRSYEETLSLVQSLEWNRFEVLVEQLYASMGYATRLTQVGADGGYDIEAVRMTPGKQERVLIDCKRHKKPVGVVVVRGMLGLVTEHRANKGVLVASSGFTRPARAFSTADPRIELLEPKTFLPLLNQHLGAKWPERLESLIAAGLRRRGGR